MRKLSISMLPLLVLASVSSHAAPDPGGGTTPAPVPTRPYSMRLAVEGTVPGQPDGNLLLVFKLTSEQLGCPLCVPTTIYTETVTVAVSGERFSTQLGSATDSPLDSTLMSGRTHVWAKWSLPSSPTVQLGSMRVSSAASAHGLSAGAVVQAMSNQPALQVHNETGRAIELRTTGPGRTVELYSTTTAVVATRAEDTHGALDIDVNGDQPSVGLRGVTQATGGTGALLKAPTGAKLINVQASSGGNQFEVLADGTVKVKGEVLQEYGPKGDTGTSGTNGTSGTDGKLTSTATFCLSSGSKTNCTGVCNNGAIVSSTVNGPCTVTASGNSCFATSGGVCCLCSVP